MNGTFSTPDTFLASALITSGEEITNLKRENGRVFFEFSESPELKAKVQRYWNETLLCDAQTLFLKHRTLKHRITNFR